MIFKFLKVSEKYLFERIIMEMYDREKGGKEEKIIKCSWRKSCRMWDIYKVIRIMWSISKY